MNDDQVLRKQAELENRRRRLLAEEAEYAPDLERVKRQNREAKALRRDWEQATAQTRREAHTKLDGVLAELAAWAQPLVAMHQSAEKAIAETRAAVYRTPCPADERLYLSSLVEKIVAEHPIISFLAFLSQFKPLPEAEQATRKAGATKEVA